MTGGLAAPLVAAGAATIIGSAGAAALGSVAGIAVMTSLFGAAGAGLTGKVQREPGVGKVSYPSMTQPEGYARWRPEGMKKCGFAPSEPLQGRLADRRLRSCWT